MFTLTNEQKIANHLLRIEQLQKKIENLVTEKKHLETKVSKLKNPVTQRIQVLDEIDKSFLEKISK